MSLAEAAPFPTTVVQLSRNFGQHPAVFAGLAEARGDIVVTMDSDLQYPPEAIPSLLAELSPATPVVSGRRVQRAAPSAPAGDHTRPEQMAQQRTVPGSRTTDRCFVHTIEPS